MNIDNDVVYSIASVPVYMTDEVEVNEKVFDVVKNLKYRKNTNSNVSIRNDVLCDDGLEEIKKQIDHKVSYYFYDVCGMSNDYELEHVSSWVNIHNKGDYAQTHKHNNSVITGVWYLQTPKDCGHLNVTSQRYLFGDTFDFVKKRRNEFNTFDAEFVSQESRLFIFPSTLMHGTGINQSEEQRISLAFNYYVRGNVFSEYNTIKV